MSELTRNHGRLQRVYLGILGAALAVAVVGAAFAAFVAGPSTAATAVAPRPTGEPRITGTPRVGEVLRTTNGTWTGTTPMTFQYRWYRCQGRGAPDASDCTRISNAPNASYVLRQADAGFRIRSQVVATNADGSGTTTSNPTNVVQSAIPVNTSAPTITGTLVVGNRLTANRGQWVGNTPITYAFKWLRCDAQGANCVEIATANDNTYVLVQADVGRTMRVRVTARNDAGSRTARSNQTGVVQSDVPATGALPVASLQAAGDRLTISQVIFSPNPVTSRTAPITARVRITARQGRPVSGAQVFMRATPRVVQGQTATTNGDGWVTLTLVPNAQFPVPRNGFNVQFFIRAYRADDRRLDGFRLVQVRLAG
jgi:hypothetical protein